MELKSYLDVLQRRWRIALIIAVVAAVVVAIGGLFMSPRYQAEAMLRIVTPLGGTPGETNYQTAFATRLMNTYAQIASSDEVRSQLKADLGVRSLPTITVKIVPDSEILRVDVESNSGALAVKTANALADILLGYEGSAGGVAEANNASVLLPRKADLEAQLASYQKMHDEILQKYSETNAELGVLDGTIRMKEGAYQSLQTQYAQAVVTDAVWSSGSSRATKDAISKESQALQAELDSLNLQYKQLSQSSSEYLQQLTLIRQNMQSTQTAYSDLLIQYDSVILANTRQQDAQKITLVSRASAPVQATGMGPLLLLALALGCGLVIGVIAAFVVDNLDTRVFVPEQIVRLGAAPVLGSISKLAGPRARVMSGAIDPALQQDSWMLAARLRALMEQDSIKSILLTSPNAGDGKSTVTYLLASSLARNNLRVLVVDAAAEKPMQSDLFKVTPEQGLYEFLKGDQDNLDQIILKNVKPGIDLLPSLAVKVNPTELLQSQRMKTVLASSKGYDAILFDMPAFLAVPDVLSMAKEGGGVVVVARSEETTSGDIEAVCNSLNSTNSKVLGIVLNQLPAKRRLSSLLQSRFTQRAAPKAQALGH